MTAPLPPHLVPGWVIDDVLDRRAHTIVVAARGAEPVIPPATPRFATIVITRPGHEAAAERELAELIERDALARADILASTIVMWDGHGVVARVMRGGVAHHARAEAPPADPVEAPTHSRLTLDRRIDERIDELAEHPVARRLPVAMAAVGAIAAVLVAWVSISPLAGGDRVARQLGDRIGVVTWDAGTATATVERSGRVLTFQLGEPGDELLLGDWEGNGARSPALYRPSTGEVWLFTSWATAEAPTRAEVARRAFPNGRAVVVAKDGRDVVNVVAGDDAAP